MAKLLQPRLKLPVLETLHIVHVMLQTAKGLLLGETGSREAWRSHILNAPNADGSKKKLHAFIRVEFQDGSRKQPTQDYHGSGRAHVHMIVWCSDVHLAALPMEKLVLATVPK
eukprot:12145102-Prorocentrum_lima.AAC.1